MPFRRPTTRGRKQLAGSEQELQNNIIKYLQYRQFYVMRMNSGMIKTEAGGMVKMGIAGTPDLLAFRPATIDRPIGVYWFEIKKPGKKSTPIQKARQDELRAAGCKVYEIHSLEEMQQIT
jgi:hypothetical protein